MLGEMIAELRLESANFLEGIAKARAGMKAAETDGNTAFGNLAKAAELNFAKSAQSSGSFGSALKLLGSSGVEMGTGVMAGAGVAAAGIGIIGAAAVEGIKSFTALGDSVYKFQTVAGGSAKSDSELMFASKELGVSTESLTKSMGLLAANVQLHPAYFQKWGVEIARNADGTVNLAGTLGILADKFKNDADVTERNAMAKQLLGKGYQALAPLLAQGSDGMRKFAEEADKAGLALSQKQVDDAHKFSLEMEGLKARAEGVAVQFGSFLVPKLMELGNLLSNVGSAASKVSQGFSLLTGVHLERLGTGLLGAIPGVGLLNSALGLLGGHHKAAADATMGHAAAAGLLNDTLNTEASAVDTTASSVKKLEDASKGVLDAQKGYADSQKAITDAVGRRNDAEAKLEDLLKKGAVDAKAVDSANHQLESSHRGVESAQVALQRSTENLDKAQDSLAKAQQKLIDVQKGAAPLDLEQADLRSKDATANVEQAKLRVIDAQDKLNQLYTNGTATSAQIEQANLDLAAAQRGVEQAQIDSQKSQTDLTKLQNEGKEGSQTLADAREGVANAEQAVQDAQRASVDAAHNLTDAIDNEAQAAQRLRDAQAGDPDFNQKVADAKRAVADASQGVADAKSREVDAAIRLRSAQAAETQAFNDGGDAVAYYWGELLGLNQQFPGAADALMGRATALGAGPGGPSSAQSAYAANSKSGTRASGGNVTAGEMYQVNEQGMEFFRPHASGTIIPLGGSSGSGGSGPMTVTININGANKDPKTIAQEVQYQLLLLQNRNTTTGLR